MDIQDKNNRVVAPWAVTIEKAENGFIMSYYDEASDDSGLLFERKELFSFDEDFTSNNSDAVMLRKLFYAIKDRFALDGSVLEVFKEEIKSE